MLQDLGKINNTLKAESAMQESKHTRPAREARLGIEPVAVELGSLVGVVGVGGAAGQTINKQSSARRQAHVNPGLSLNQAKLQPNLMSFKVYEDLKYVVKATLMMSFVCLIFLPFPAFCFTPKVGKLNCH